MTTPLGSILSDHAPIFRECTACTTHRVLVEKVHLNKAWLSHASWLVVVIGHPQSSETNTHKKEKKQDFKVS